MKQHIRSLMSSPSVPALHIAILHALGKAGAKEIKDAADWCKHLRLLHEQAENDYRKRAA